MYDEILEILDKIDVEQHDREDGSLDIKLSAQLNTSEVGDLCEGVASWSPYESDGWRFWYETLSEEDIFKIAFFLRKTLKSDQMPIELRLGCGLTYRLVKEALQLPCEIELAREDSDYFTAVEEKLDFWLPIDDFEAAHEKCHNIIKVLNTSYETGGWVRKLHLN